MCRWRKSAEQLRGAWVDGLQLSLLVALLLSCRPGSCRIMDVDFVTTTGATGSMHPRIAHRCAGRCAGAPEFDHKLP